MPSRSGDTRPSSTFMLTLMEEYKPVSGGRIVGTTAAAKQQELQALHSPVPSKCKLVWPMTFCVSAASATVFDDVSSA